jgi:small subunit ribosomal protein S20
MANIKSAIKRIKVNKTKQTRNKPAKTALATTVKKCRTNPTDENLRNAFSALDSAAGKNIIHQNKADRQKAALAKLADSKKETKKPVKMPHSLTRQKTFEK